MYLVHGPYRGSSTYNTDKLVANILSPLIGNTIHFINNSQDLVNKLFSYTLSTDEQLVSFDVSALFTSVPIQESLSIIKNRLLADTSL